jgi:hypothetical protein
LACAELCYLLQVQRHQQHQQQQTCWPHPGTHVLLLLLLLLLLLPLLLPTCACVLQRCRMPELGVQLLALVLLLLPQGLATQVTKCSGSGDLQELHLGSRQRLGHAVQLQQQLQGC